MAFVAPKNALDGAEVQWRPISRSTRENAPLHVSAPHAAALLLFDVAVVLALSDAAADAFFAPDARRESFFSNVEAVRVAGGLR